MSDRKDPFSYEYYLKLKSADGLFGGRIKSTIDLRGLVAPWTWLEERDNILTDPTIEAVLVLKEPNPYDGSFK